MLPSVSAPASFSVSRPPLLIDCQPPCRQVPRSQDPPLSSSVSDSDCTSVLSSVLMSTSGFICAGVIQGVPVFALATGSAKVSTSARDLSNVSLLLACLLACPIVLSPTHCPVCLKLSWPLHLLACEAACELVSRSPYL